MRTKRLRMNIRNYLDGKIPPSWIEKGVIDRNAGPASTHEILDVYNGVTRHGTTPQQLGNVLSKDEHIIKVGSTRVSGSGLSGRYTICMWASDDYVLSLIPDFKKGDRVIMDEHGNLEKIIGRD